MKMFTMQQRPGGPLAWRVACFALCWVACADAPGGEDAADDVGDSPPVTYVDGTPSGACGDGTVDENEGCDEGEANANDRPDACRLDCLPARCGDGVLDGGEACDDGNEKGADGCDPSCQVESGQFELEPNDGLDAANALERGIPLTGFLSDGDVDCYVYDLAIDGHWVRAQVGLPDVTCEGAMTISVYDDEGDLIGSETADRPGDCPSIRPRDYESLRLLRTGRYYICVESLMRRGERSYEVLAESANGCGDQTWDVPVLSDVDGDGLDALCDDDDDGDGYADEDDNCPELSNGGGTPSFALASDGGIRHWIGVGFDEESEAECMPLVESRFDPLLARPAPGDPLGEGLAWTYAAQSGDTLSLSSAFGGGSERAAWVYAYVDVEAALSAELRFGSDDGARVVVNGVEVFQTSACRGVSRDADVVPVELVAGANVIAFKVYNGGGGWGVRARLTDLEGNSLSARVRRHPDPNYVDNQSDRDGDGVGDACDLD